MDGQVLRYSILTPHLVVQDFLVAYTFCLKIRNNRIKLVVLSHSNLRHSLIIPL